VADEERSVEAVAVPGGEVARLQAIRPRSDRRLPSRRSIVVGVLLLALAGGAYLVARETSAFALRSIEVDGAPGPLGAQVRAALAPLVGRSLLSVDRGDAARRVRALPEVASVSVDRAFPHELRVTVREEQSVAVLRQADHAWLVGGDARVLRALTTRPYPALPRIWVPRDVDVLLGSTLAGDAADAVSVAAALAGRRVPLAVRTIEARGEDVTVMLRSGVGIRLGDTASLLLKLAVAARIIPLAPGARYIDVTVPERAVAAYKSQAAG
jgi:cell division protein FtsQ